MKSDKFLNWYLSMVAKDYIGIREQNAQKGQIRQMLRSTVENNGDIKSLCMAFVHLWIKGAEMALRNYRPEDDDVPVKIFLSENCLTSWERSPQQHSLEPTIGSLCIWQKFDGDQPLNNGHVGVIIELHENGVISVVEGNTRNLNCSDETGCDGVNLFLYKTEKMDRGALKFKGFLNVW